MMERFRSSPTDIVAQLQRRIAALEARANTSEAANVGSKWIPLTLQNAWTYYEASPYGTYGPPAFMKDKSGIVRLRGLVKSGAASTAIATLPAQYRPAYAVICSVLAADAVARIDVFNNGVIQFQSGSNAWVNLWDITFPAEL
jgi:hypothetical protein